MGYIIGVDGGGTKTKASAYSLDDKEIGKGQSGFGNLLLDFDKAVNNIIEAVERCKSSIKEQFAQEECLCIYLGIAGIEADSNIEKIETLLKEKFHCKVNAFHDSELAHAAMLKGQDGIITISGTGSVCYGIYKGKKERTGGWGHILGDEGSGYYIALEAFKRAALEEDLGSDRSELTIEIMSKLKLDNVNEVKGFIYSATKGEIAAYVPVVAKLAEATEVNSVNILRAAGKDLAVMTERNYKKLGIDGSVKVALKGGVLCKVAMVRQEFINCIERDLGSLVDIIVEDISSTKGACYLHRRKEEEVCI